MITGDQGKIASESLSSIYVFHKPNAVYARAGHYALALCTRSKKGYRAIGIRPQAQYEALQEARKRENTQEWKAEYTRRAGIEGTNSQGIRSFDLRRARYIGLSKAHLQHILTAAAINVVRFSNWVSGVPLAKTRISAFEAIRPMAA